MSLPLVRLVVALCLVATACEAPAPPSSSTAPSGAPTASGPPVARVRQVVLTRLAQLPADEGANGIVFDAASSTAYVATYSGADSITQISPDGDKAIAQYLLPDRPEFGSLVSDIALTGRTLFLNRSLLERLSLFDVRSGKVLRELSARDLGVAHIGAVVAGSTDHVFVLATGPLPVIPPFIADSFILELDQDGVVVRRASVPRLPISAYPSGATGSAFDARSGSLFFGGLSDTADAGLISVLDANARQTRPFIHTVYGARILAVDGSRHLIYLASGETRVDVYDSLNGTLLKTVTFDRPLGTSVFNDQADVLIVTTPYRGTDADLVLVLDPITLRVLTQAEVPWDPYAHGIVLDPKGTRLYVSSRVRPASVTTFGLAVGP